MPDMPDMPQVIVCLLLLFAASASTDSFGDFSIVSNVTLTFTLPNATSDSSVTGEILRQDATNKTIFRFLRIRYGVTGNKTFSPAEGVTPDTLNSGEQASRCPQASVDSTSTDCLFLNIWGPANTSQTLPVVVVLRGVDFLEDSHDENDGASLAVNQDVVVVTVSFRLGSFGFLFVNDSSGSSIANVGLQDQRLALKFINGVVDKFGGSPHNVTLVGHGADAAAVAFHAVDPESSSLLHRVVMMGGSPHSPTIGRGAEDALDAFSRNFVKQVGCNDTDTIDNIVQCLETLDVAKVVQEQTKVTRNSSLNFYGFQPILTSEFFDKLEAVEMPAILGVAESAGRGRIERIRERLNDTGSDCDCHNLIRLHFEFLPRFPEKSTCHSLKVLHLLLLPEAEKDHEKVKSLLTKSVTDFHFACPVWQAAGEFTNSRVYLFTGDSDVTYEDDDLRHLLGLTGDSGDANVTQEMQKFFGDFVRDSLSSSSWPAVMAKADDSRRSFMHFRSRSAGDGKDSSVESGGFSLKPGGCSLWRHAMTSLSLDTEASVTSPESPSVNSDVINNDVNGKLLQMPSPKMQKSHTPIEDFTVTVNSWSAQVTGTTYQANNNNKYFSEFLAVPYAKTLRKDTRFQKAEMHPGGVTIIAKSQPDFCWQNSSNLPMSEDCLYLNIWTPSSKSSSSGRHPVVVFIHGGAFSSGGIADSRWQGRWLLQHHDVVVVTFNFRLGVFGFLPVDNSTENWNLGLQDQHLAMSWIRRNIAFFGGNSTSITLVGVESGAASALLLPRHDSAGRVLFDRRVLLTGSSKTPRFVASGVKEFQHIQEKLKSHFNCSDSLVECLRGIEAAELNSAVNELNVFERWVQQFAPVVGGKLVDEDPLTGSIKDSVPTIAGRVDRPGKFWVDMETNLTHETFLETLVNAFSFPITGRQPLNLSKNFLTEYHRDFFNSNDSVRDRDLLADALSHRFFTQPDNLFLSEMNQTPVYSFVFAEQSSDPRMTGATLYDDAFFAFGNPIGIAGETQGRLDLSRMLMSQIVDFANDRLNTDEWPAYTKDDKKYLKMESGSQKVIMSDGFQMESFRLWTMVGPLIENFTIPHPETTASTSTASTETSSTSGMTSETSLTSEVTTSTTSQTATSETETSQTSTSMTPPLSTPGSLPSTTSTSTTSPDSSSTTSILTPSPSPDSSSTTSVLTPSPSPDSSSTTSILTPSPSPDSSSASTLTPSPDTSSTTSALTSSSSSVTTDTTEASSSTQSLSPETTGSTDVSSDTESSTDAPDSTPEATPEIPTTKSSTATSKSTPETTAENPTTQPDTGSPGLSTLAIVLICVGSVAFVLATGAGVVLLLAKYTTVVNLSWCQQVNRVNPSDAMENAAFDAGQAENGAAAPVAAEVEG